MSHEPDYVPPPPSQGGAPKETLLFGVFGLALASFVLYALYQSTEENIIETGAGLIALGLVFGVGLVSRSEIVHYLTAGILMFSGGIAIGLALNTERAYWYVGAALFFVCAALLVAKEQIVSRM
jgi:hypothetical protein